MRARNLKVIRPQGVPVATVLKEEPINVTAALQEVEVSIPVEEVAAKPIVQETQPVNAKVTKPASKKTEQPKTKPVPWNKGKGKK